MQMRTAADAARAGHADGLSLLDHRADAHRALGKVLVGGRVAAAVADDDVLPAHTVARRNDDRAGLGGIDGGAVVHAADVDAAVVGGGALDAGVALAEGRCDALAGRHGPNVAAVGHRCVALLRGKLLAQADDLLLRFFLLGLDLGEHVLIIRLVLLHFLDETGRLGALITQLVVLDRQRLLGALLLGERGLERLLLFRDLRLQHAQVVDHALISLHHLADEVHRAEQLLKARRLEKHRPVGHRPALLHRAHALAEQLVLIRLLRLRLAELLLGLLDERFILRDLLLGVGDLLADEVDLLIEQRLALERVGLVLFERAELLVHLALLA